MIKDCVCSVCQRFIPLGAIEIINERKEISWIVLQHPPAGYKLDKDWMLNYIPQIDGSCEGSFFEPEIILEPGGNELNIPRIPR